MVVKKLLMKNNAAFIKIISEKLRSSANTYTESYTDILKETIED